MPAQSPAAAPAEPQIDEHGRSYGTGRRKDAVARVWMKRGKGVVTVNGKPLLEYFARPVLQMMLMQPFAIADRLNQYDVICTVKGGGLSGQAGAVRHGLSRALIAYEPELRPTMKKNGFLNPRCPRCRTEEIRPPQSASFLPVLEALRFAHPLIQKAFLF